MNYSLSIRIRHLTVLLIFAANLFAGINASSANIDRVQLIRKLPQTDNGYVADMILFNNKAFFLWQNYPNDELWVSDGTESGTKMIKKLSGSGGACFLTTPRIGYGSDARGNNSDPITINNKFYFCSGYALWRSDGTAAGTVFVKQIPGISSYVSKFAVLNDLIYIIDYDFQGHLWRTDGTAAGTWKVFSFSNVRELVAFHGKLYLGASLNLQGVPSDHNNELWVSDGTAAGTKLFVDINPFVTSGCCSLYCADTCAFSDSWPTKFIVHNNELYFTANDGVHGNTLWKTNGTLAGTIMLSPPGTWANVGNIFSAGKYLLFGGTDAIHGDELWKTDGTRNGTILLKDLKPGSGSSLALAGFVGKIDDEVYFTTGGSAFGSTGDLWETDGTRNGTKLVKYGVQGSCYTSSSMLDGRLYFNGNPETDPYNDELWVTDGTSTGTHQVRDIFPGVDEYDRSNDSSPSNFVTLGESILFTAAYDSYYAAGGYTYWKFGLFKIDRSNCVAPVLNLLIPGR